MKRALPAMAVITLALAACTGPVMAAEEPVNAPAAKLVAKEDGLQTAIFAGGCFWGVEGVFSHVKGVTAAVAGYPALTVPMGHSDGLPLGLTFIGPAWSEARLLRIGHAYEQLTRARHPPGFAAGSPQSVAPGNTR